MKKIVIGFAGLFSILVSTRAQAACTPTGFFRDSTNMTAAMINPPGTVSGTVDATGCNIGIYYDNNGTGGTVNGANIYAANYFGVVANGDAGAVSVDVLNSNIHDIGESPLNGSQHGVGIYFRGFNDVSIVTGKIAGNTIAHYQKGGVVTNGPGVQAIISDNIVTGEGHIPYIAQNGIQVGYGANASVMRNTVTGNSYIGFPGDGSASGGVLVVGGDCYGGPLTIGTQIVQNLLQNNDVGAYLSNLNSDCAAPTAQTNVKVINNVINDDQCFNASYQAAISDVGNNDKMNNNKISGPGYIGCTTFYNPSGNAIDADPSFTNRPKVHANK
jgi:hypothetical protein